MAAEFLRWPQGGPTLYGYILQAVGVVVELYRGVITFFISTFAVAIRQAEKKELVKKKPTRYRPSGRTFAFGPPAVALRAPCVCLENSMAAAGTP